MDKTTIRIALPARTKVNLSSLPCKFMTDSTKQMRLATSLSDRLCAIWTCNIATICDQGEKDRAFLSILKDRASFGTR